MHGCWSLLPVEIELRLAQRVLSRWLYCNAIQCLPEVTKRRTHHFSSRKKASDWRFVLTAIKQCRHAFSSYAKIRLGTHNRWCLPQLSDEKAMMKVVIPCIMKKAGSCIKAEVARSRAAIPVGAEALPMQHQLPPSYVPFSERRPVQPLCYKRIVILLATETSHWPQISRTLLHMAQPTALSGCSIQSGR